MTEVACVMATRREDSRARANWRMLLADVTDARRLTGLIMDRTPSAAVPEELRLAGWEEGRSKLRVIRQSYDAPIREIWRTIKRVDAPWLVTLADDDQWSGLSRIGLPVDASVSVIAPSLSSESSAGISQIPFHPIRTQHVLHGFVRHDVLRTVGRYLSEAPTPWGGEDALLVFAAEGFGRVVQSSDYCYCWNSHNWEPESQQEVLESYLRQAGWGDMSGLSTYLLAQSLDRLAVTAYARDEMDEANWLSLVSAAMARFWPVTDEHHNAIYRRFPGPVRRAILQSRGLAGGARVRRTLGMAAVYSVAPRPKRRSLERYATGTQLLATPEDVLAGIIPALRAAAPQGVQDQIDFWSACITDVQRFSQAVRPH
jgi:hypothetical protein